MSVAYTALAVTVITAIAGTAVTIEGQKQQAKAAQQAADYNAAVARQDADTNNLMAAENARRAQAQQRRTLAQIRASNAANGLGMEGTPLAVLGDVKSTMEQEIEDMGYYRDAQNRGLIAGAAMGQWQARATGQALKTQQWATGISGVGQAAGGYLSASGQVAPSSTTINQ